MTPTTPIPPARGRNFDGPPSTAASVPSSSTRTTAAIGLDEMIGALRSLPHGGIDDTARRLALPPRVRGTISPLIMSLRWSAAMFGMIFGTKAALGGDLDVVVTLTLALFLTSWRTTLPIRLGSTDVMDRVVAMTDTVFLAVAVGWSGGPSSPFVFCVMTAVAVAAFGWGYLSGITALALAWAGMVAGVGLHGELLHLSTGTSLGAAGGLFIAALLPALISSSLLDNESDRALTAGRLDALSETNDLLTMLNAVARTLPTSLNLRDAVDTAREQITITFHPSVICLIEYDETGDEWVPKLAEGCVLRPTSHSGELPSALRSVIDLDEPRLVPNIRTSQQGGISTSSGSGIYVRLVARGRTVGLLGLEHPLPEHFTDRDVRLLKGFAELLALSLDNARWFGRLRSLGAEEERSRIARDLHDRLGQWLTYISFELERIISTDGPPSPELSRLYSDVQTALDELRDTLRQLRSGVSVERSLAKVGQEVVDRFVERTDIETNWVVVDPAASVSVPIENELLRILQESLNNTDKHAKASRVDIRWDVRNGAGVLTITDDGVGFDAAQGVRDTAYGLVGMRERADTVGARLTINSTPGEGTTIIVSTGTSPGTKET